MWNIRKTIAQYFSVRPGLSSGEQLERLLIDNDGVLLTRETGGGSASPSRFNSAGDVASLVVKASGGNLFDYEAYNAAAATRYVQVFNATALPANGTVPDLMPLEIPAAGTGSLAFVNEGCPFTTGIVIAISSTRATLTIAAANMWVSGRFS